jgi:serine O-acetyltransferase
MLSSILADLRHYSRFCCGGKPLWRAIIKTLYAHPASTAVIWYRLGSFAWGLKVPVARQLLQLIYLLGMPLVRMYSGIQILPRTKIGPGLVILHFGGVVITEDCEIGENCLLYHNVSIVTMKNHVGPRIGSNFYAGTGATIIGTITIEDNVTAGSGCVITKSVPRDAVVAGVPARILRFRLPDENPTENRTGPNRLPGRLSAPDSQEPRTIERPCD